MITSTSINDRVQALESAHLTTMQELGEALWNNKPADEIRTRLDQIEQELRDARAMGMAAPAVAAQHRQHVERPAAVARPDPRIAAERYQQLIKDFENDLVTIRRNGTLEAHVTGILDTAKRAGGNIERDARMRLARYNVQP